MTDSNTTSNALANKLTYSDELELLNATFAKYCTLKKLSVSAYLTVEQIDVKKYPNLKSVFTQFLEFFGITDLTVPFLKFHIDKDGYKGIRFPVLGTVGRDVALMMGSKSYVITPIWGKKTDGKRLKFLELDKQTFMFISCDDVDLESINIPFYLVEQKEGKAVKPTSLVTLETALDNIAPLTFSTTSLEDGKYHVASFTKKGTRCNAIIVEKGEQKNCFVSEYMFKNLATCRDEGRETFIVVNGWKETKTGKYRNVYVDGFPPLNFKKFGALIEEYLQVKELDYSLIDLCPSYKLKEEDIDKLIIKYELDGLKENEAKIKAEKQFKKSANENSSNVFPIKFKLDGIQRVEKNQNNDVGAYLIINYSGTQYHVGLSSSMKRDFLNGVLDLGNFDDCYVVINGIGVWQAYFTYQTEWEIPVQQMNLSGVDELEAMMF